MSSTSYSSDLVPLPQCPASFINPSSGTPVNALAIVAGDTTRLLTVVNDNAARLDAVGRYGGGCYAIVSGLAISAGAGLTLNISAGQATLDGPVTVAANTTLALPDNTLKLFIWLSQARAPTSVSNSITPPVGIQCFLGTAVTAGGVITSTDVSGVCYARGGTLVRATADTSCPTDTPPAGLALITEGAAGCWLWDGNKYLCLSGGRAALTFSSDANKTLSTPEATNSLIDFTSGGTTLTATRNAVLPTEAGRIWHVRNASPGAQSLVFKTAAGTGVTVATGKAAIVAGDGTNIFRLGADV